MTFEELKAQLKGLIDETSSVELVEKVAKISTLLEEKEKDEKNLIQSKEELRTKYVEAVKQNSFRVEEDKSTHEEENPKSLEDCFKEALNSKK